MKLALSPKLEQLVQKKVKSGQYSSAAEVVREALRLLEERDFLSERRRRDLRKKIADGLESLRRGESVDGEAVFDRLEAELDALERRKAG